MASNTYINKVVYNNNTLIDLTSDTVTASTLMQGYTAHDASGSTITGTATTVDEFNIILTLTNGEWLPDKTFAQVQAAVAAGDAIILSAYNSSGNEYCQMNYTWLDDNEPPAFFYSVVWFDYDDTGLLYKDGYSYTSDGVEMWERQTYSAPMTLVEKTVTANGIYDYPISDSADGYSSVIVDVPNTTLQSLTITPSTSQQIFTGNKQMGNTPLMTTKVSQGGAATPRTATFYEMKPSVGTEYWVVPIEYTNSGAWSEVRRYDPVLWTASETNTFLLSTLAITNEYIKNYSSITRYGIELYPVSSSLAYSPVTVEPIPSNYIVPTGIKSITENGTGIDVAQYASVDVMVPIGVDTSQDTVDAAHLLSGYTAHDSTGIQITGTYVAPTLYNVSMMVYGQPPTWTGIDEDAWFECDGETSWISIAAPSGAAVRFCIFRDNYNITRISKNGSDMYNTALSLDLFIQNPVNGYYYYDFQVTDQDLLIDVYFQAGVAGTPTATKGTVSNHSVSVTPSVTNTTGYITGGTLTGSAVTVSALELVSGTLSITQNGTHDVTNYANANVNVSPNLQAKTATPTESQQTVQPDSGYDGLSSVEIGAISSTYVGSEVTRRSSTDLTISGATITVPSGYYSSDASTSITNGTLSDPTITYINAGTWTGSITVNNKVGTSGYLTSNTSKSKIFTLSEVLPTQTAKTITPTESIQTAVDQYKWTTGTIIVDAIPSTYVGSDITYRDDTDLTASGATVTVPVGYYAEQASKIIASGTEGTPTATKGTVSNHTVTVTPSVTNSAGYIVGGTKSGTPISVSASELVSGTYTISASGTHDVINYASASVAAGDATASATKGTVSNHSITVTPSVTRTAGYVTAGSANGTSVTVSASELVSGSETYSSNGTHDVTNLASVTVAVPFSTIYTSSSNPTSSQGNDGDVWLVIA